MGSQVSLPVAYRPARPADVPYMTDSWLRGLYEIDHDLTPDEFYGPARAIAALVIQRALALGNVIVACSTEDEDQIFGYAIQEFPVHCHRLYFHWINVKGAFRRMGLASGMIAHAIANADVKEWHYTTRPYAEGTGACFLATQEAACFDPFAYYNLGYFK